MRAIARSSEVQDTTSRGVATTPRTVPEIPAVEISEPEQGAECAGTQYEKPVALGFDTL